MVNAKSMLFTCTLSHGILNNVQWLSRLLLIGRTPLGMGLYFVKAQQNNFIYCRYGLYLNIFKGNTEVWFIFSRSKTSERCTKPWHKMKILKALSWMRGN